MTPKILSELDAEGSILFLGSGFSHSAKNIRGTGLPTGSALRHHFANLLNINADDYDLKTLADEIDRSTDHDLYQIIYQLYTVKTLSSEQNEILSLPWLRIYTTNYDDSVENFSLVNRIPIPSYSYNQDKPVRLQPRSVIHLHGSIRDINEENILEHLILNESSYVRQHFETSIWYSEFSRDLRFCTSCFFVGYGLSDYNISALLMQDPDAKEKTFFISRKTPDQIFVNRVEQFGSVLPVEVDGFARLCNSLPKPHRDNNPLSLKAFLYLDPFKDKKTLHPPTANEILNLVTYGSFNYQRCISTLPDSTYVVPRQKLASDAADMLSEVKCLLVHSRIGNGKTIFLHILAHKLSQQGYHCFWLRSNPRLFHEDVEILKSIKKLVIFIDSYNAAIEYIQQVAGLPQDTKFIVSVRTAVQDVRLHEIQACLPKSLNRINLNTISREDKSDLFQLLDQSGIMGDDFDDVIKRAGDFRDIIVGLYKNRKVREKIEKEFSPLLNDPDFKSVFVVSHLLKWIGHDVDVGFVRSVTRKDPYGAVAKFRETAGDIFALDDDRLSVRSAILSEYLIQNHISSEDISEHAYYILIEAVKRKREPRFQVVLSGLMRFSALYRAMANDPNRIERIKILFDRLHRDIDMNREPLFWLQYSILMTGAEDLAAAEAYITTAYLRAGDSPGFQTFQIDTYALKLFLLIEQREVKAQSVKRFENIIQKLERVRSMIGEENRRYHAIQVLDGLDPFVVSRIQYFSTDEKNALIYHINLLVDSLDNLSPDQKAVTGSNNIRSGLLTAKSRVLMGK